MSLTKEERFVPDSVTIIADDLTGALDSAAPFADTSPAGKIPVVWSPSAIPGRISPLGVSTETRELSAAAARSCVLDALAALPQAGLHFKKIDSLARGNTAVEIAACAESGLFTSLIVAPAFPQQGRRVAGGRIKAAGVLVDLGGLLAKAKVTFDTCLPGAGIPVRKGVALCDAVTDADLKHIVAAAGLMAAPVLFCGSGGLAGALTPPQRRFRDAPLPNFAVVGSQTAISQANLTRLSQSFEIAIRSAPGAWRGPVDWAARRLAVGFDMPTLKADDARRAINETLREVILSRAQPEAMFVVGGDTLRSMLDAAGATSVDVEGAWAPGIAVSRLTGGRWAGTWLYSISGSFDDTGLIKAILQGDRCSEHP